MTEQQVTAEVTGGFEDLEVIEEYLTDQGRNHDYLIVVEAQLGRGSKWWPPEQVGRVAEVLLPYAITGDLESLDVTLFELSGWLSPTGVDLVHLHNVRLKGFKVLTFLVKCEQRKNRFFDWVRNLV